ncbi:MAG: lytic transglycosylase domain-containing protein [Alphaproteobacteria bacterium]|nr:lytic transglycosylase domain-containing protein [Alphaproteobacteria bacterium]
MKHYIALCFGLLLWLGVCVGLAMPQASQARPLPLPRPDYQPPPKTPDPVLYRQIFELQEETKWKEADKHIRQLDDRSLLGHVYRQRYMHPTAYRAKWGELNHWLRNYADHPGAWQVYKLAQRRKPRNARPPKAPPARIWRQTALSPQIQPRLFRKRGPKQIRREVQRLTYKERPTQALRYIKRRDIDRQLTAAETDSLRALIARSYYIEHKPEKALEIATLAIRSRQIITTADWHAGLAAWRLGKLDIAGAHFTILANNENASARYRAAAAVWAARVHIAQGKPDAAATAANMLKLAVKTGGNNFYGLLAHRRLNGPVAIEWQAAPIETNIEAGTQDTQNIENKPFLAHKAVQRALKLLEASQQELAEWELVYLGERVLDKDAATLLQLAQARNLPSLELAMTHRLELNKTEQPHILSEGQFPIPAYGPIAGYILDRAILLGLIRQESRFKARAKSYAGARGLMQIMPATAAFVTGDRKLRYRSGRNKLFGMALNMNIGQAYLKGLLEDEAIRGNLMLALASYNAGPGNVQRWQNEIGENDDPLLFMESLPAPETRLYIQKVLRNIWLYRDRLGQAAPSLEALAAGLWPFYVQQDPQ